MTMPNFPLLDEAIGFAERSFQQGEVKVSIKNDGTIMLQWNQDQWVLDTKDYDDDVEDWVASEDDLKLPAEDHERSCGTQCCIAGYVAIAEGYLPMEKSYGDWTSVINPLTKDSGSIGTVARELLKITRPESDLLFSGQSYTTAPMV